MPEKGDICDWLKQQTELHRIGRGTIHTENLCLSIFGNTQPAKLMSYLYDAIHGRNNDELLQRFQVLVYPDEPNDWRLVAKYRKLMPSLALIFHLLEIADGKSSQAISCDSALLAIGWCNYLENHARRIYGMPSESVSSIDNEAG